MAGTLAAHDGQRSLGQPHHTEEVGIDLGAEVAEIDVLDCPHVGVTGVVDQHVETSKAVDSDHDCVANLLVVGHVERGDRQRVGVLGGEVVQRRGRANAGDHAMSCPQCRFGDGAPEAAGGARNEEHVRLIGHGNSL